MGAVTAPRSLTTAEELRGAGLRVTAVRVALLETVRSGDHLGVEAVASGVRDRVGHVSLQAVYDALHALTVEEIVTLLNRALDVLHVTALPELLEQIAVYSSGDARTAYNLGPKDLFFLDRSLRSDRPVKAIYHSHVDFGAYFSAATKPAATPGYLLWVADLFVNAVMPAVID